MSETVFAKLPSFDEPVSSHRKQTGLKSFDAPEVAPEPVPAEEDDAAAAAASELDEAAQARLAAIEETLTSLAGTMDELDARARTRTTETVLEISKKLFPELSDLFLAEEIARHLPRLLPESAPNVEIRAEPHLADQLEEIVHRSNRLSGRCTVISDETPGKNRAEVSWGAGGLSFDFGGLLQACLSQLRASQANRGELT